MQRRDLLVLVGGSATVAVSGCLGDDDDEGVDDGIEDTDDTGDETDDTADETDDTADDGDENGGEEEPASFEVDNLDPADTTADLGDLLVVSVDVTNTGDEAGTKDVELRIGDETLATEELELAGGESETGSFEVDTAEFEPGEYTHSVWTEDDDVAGTLTLEEVVPATFEVENLDPEETTAPVGEILAIAADITNTGDEAGEKAVELRLDGDTALTQDLELAAGESETVEIEIDTTDLEIGEYEHSIWTEDGEQAGTLTLEEPTTPAAVQLSEPVAEGGTLTVEYGRLDDGGFVTVHDSSWPEEEVDSTIAASAYLEPGEHDQIVVELSERPEDGEELFAIPHRDSNENEVFDFVDTGGEEDPPYTDDTGEAITDSAVVSVPPTVAETVDEANAIVDEINNGDPSLSTTNERLENVEPVELVEPVEAETAEEASEEADRLREEFDRVEEEMFTQVPKEINEQAQDEVGFDITDPEEIHNSEDAREEADDLEVLNEEAAEALRDAADLVDGIEEALHEAADVLDTAVNG